MNKSDIDMWEKCGESVGDVWPIIILVATSVLVFLAGVSFGLDLAL